MKKYIKQIRGLIILSVVLFGMESVVSSLILFLPGFMIDNFENSELAIVELILLYLGLFCLYLLISYVSNRIGDYRRVKFESSIKKDFFDKIMCEDYKQFTQYEIGEYISMQSNDISELCTNYLGPYIGIIRSFVMISILGIVLIVTVDFTVAVAVILFSALVVFVPGITSNKLSERNNNYMKQLGEYTTKVSSYYKSYEILDDASRESIIKEHDKDLNNVFKKMMNFRKLNSFSYVLNGGSAETVSIITFILVSFLLVNKSITVGMATIAFMYSSKFTDPIYELNINLSSIKSIKKIEDKLNAILAKKAINDHLYLVHDFNQIEFIDVIKQYDSCLIKLPNLVFKKGGKYLVTGNNGVGKSVTLKMLMKYVEADQGSLFIDAQDYSSVSINEINSYIPQKSIIFDTDYLNNVTLFNTYHKNLALYESFFPATTIEKIKSATTVINLSGGEHQIIALIRGLCMEKEILLLDEAMSAMHQDVIEEFLRHLDKLDRTVIMVAHNFQDYYHYFSDVYSIERSN